MESASGTSKRQRHDDADEGDFVSLSRPISPPRKRIQEKAPSIPSPWQLTWIRDLPESQNQDALTLKDLLGDPLIASCWEFNFLHDIPFLMNAFDPDTRHLVQVHVVHGFWKKEDLNRQALAEDASRFSNVHLHAAPMFEPFANMIEKDWTNMTNAVWKSPLMPKLNTASSRPKDHNNRFGSGEKFKIDLLDYLGAYNARWDTCKALVRELELYEFSAVRAALIASVPGRHPVNDETRTAWGWAALKSALGCIGCDDDESEVVVQVSSIATLGAKDDWLQRTLFDSLAVSRAQRDRPTFKVVFPTADEVRRSLDGYASGASIHTKLQSAQQFRQLEYLRPILHHWANDCEEGEELPVGTVSVDGGRNRAAPHIKTYIRYSAKGTVDWALLTSANISKQAWGEAAKSTGEMRIASWEVGVLVWPELMGERQMVGAFKSDTPKPSKGISQGMVGIRIPYSLPLQRYGSSEVPWVTSAVHSEPDSHGRRWGAGM